MSVAKSKCVLLLYQPKTGGELLRLHEGVSSRVPHLQAQMPAVDYSFVIGSRNPAVLVSNNRCG